MISTLKIERGLALPDLLNGAFEFIDGLQLKPAARVYLLDILATIEYVLPFLRFIIVMNRHFHQTSIVNWWKREDTTDGYARRFQECRGDLGTAMRSVTESCTRRFRFSNGAARGVDLFFDETSY